MYNNALNAENSNLLGFFILSEKDITSGEMSMGIKSNTQRCYGYCNGASPQPSSFPPDPLSLQIFLLAHPLKPPTTSIFSNPVYYSLSLPLTLFTHPDNFSQPPTLPKKKSLSSLLTISSLYINSPFHPPTSQPPPHFNTIQSLCPPLRALFSAIKVG